MVNPAGPAGYRQNRIGVANETDRRPHAQISAYEPVQQQGMALVDHNSDLDIDSDTTASGPPLIPTWKAAPPTPHLDLALLFPRNSQFRQYSL